MENEIKIGDKVQLKSGGPDMVIVGFYEDPLGIDKTPMAYCVWHDLLQNEQNRVYPISGLIKVG